MATIMGNGAPTRKTKGATGDIYTDRTTGKQYECVFAYRDNIDEEFDCQWKEIKTAEKSEIESEKIPDGDFQEKHSEKSVVEEEINENETKIEENPTQKRTNYAAYSKNSKKHNVK